MIVDKKVRQIGNKEGRGVWEVGVVEEEGGGGRGGGRCAEMRVNV